MARNGSPRISGNKNKGKECKATVLIASADAAVRHRWLTGLQDLFTVHEVSERAKLEHSLASEKPSILLLDLSLPQIGGESGISAIQHLSASTKIILFSCTPDEREAIGALKAGAKGYWSRDIEPPLLRKAVRVVEKGEVWVRRQTISHLLEELAFLSEIRQKDCPNPPEVCLTYLTRREHQIARLVGEGSCNKEIASQLKITERTVKAHMSNIFSKLQISDRLRLGLLVNAHSRANHFRAAR